MSRRKRIFLGRDTCDLLEAVESDATAHRDKVLAAWKAIASGEPLSHHEPFIRAVAKQVVAVEEHARSLSALPAGERKSRAVLNSARIKDLGGCLGLGGTPDKYARIRAAIDAADLDARLSDPDRQSQADGWVFSASELKDLIKANAHLLPPSSADPPPKPEELLAAVRASAKRGTSRKK